MSGRFVGIDWGTTHRRITLLDAQGQVLATRHDEQGTLASAGRFAASLQAALDAMPQAAGAPVVMSGMVGSAVGWQEVPYAEAGSPLVELRRQLAPLREAPTGCQAFIVPGIRWRDEQGRIDVMRGEETQLLGACHLLGPEAADGWYVLPGTHSKWVRLQQGRVTALRTYMSGELYALLRERGTLSSLMQAGHGGWDDALFEQGAAASDGEALSHALFGARARVVGGGAPAAGTAAFVSGVLIGAEWRDLQRQPVEGPVRLIGEPALSRLHALCARRWGVATEVLDAQALQLAAWRALQASLET
jgi:2-dehydro-3-deoxygalactonokinase